MAAINEQISLGIGTPADIKSFVLFGLQPNPSGTTTVQSSPSTSIALFLRPKK